MLRTTEIELFQKITNISLHNRIEGIFRNLGAILDFNLPPHSPWDLWRLNTAAFALHGRSLLRSCRDFSKAIGSLKALLIPSKDSLFCPLINYASLFLLAFLGFGSPTASSIALSSSSVLSFLGRKRE
jgi:hypothetical protein